MSTYGFQPINYTLVALADVPVYHIVQLSSLANYGTLATAKTQMLGGVNQTDQPSGQHMTVCGFGISKTYCGSAVSVGDRITSNASGRAIAAGSGDTVVGWSMDAGVSGDIIRVMCLSALDKTSS